MVEHLGIAPSIPTWKAGVYLSTPMLETKLESRKGIAPLFAVLQTAACATRPTGQAFWGNWFVANYGLCGVSFQKMSLPKISITVSAAFGV
jgi:hypothetical protein